MQSTLHRTTRLTPIAFALLAFSATVAAQTATPPKAEATLEQVNVRSKYEREDLPLRAPGHKAASGARLGILGATSILEAPVHVNAYTRELAEDWSAFSLQDVLENDSAIVFTTNKNHLLQNFNLRGLDMTAMDIATNGLYGIAPANAVPVEMFERIEVLRGPNVLLSGMPPLSSVAGTVNMVTKRALAQPIADLTLTYGSKSYFQAHADLGKRFGSEKRLGVRFNGVYGDGEMGAKEAHGIGIAQVMPGTARDRGLADPFVPHEALQASASLLADLRDRMGARSCACHTDAELRSASDLFR